MDELDAIADAAEKFVLKYAIPGTEVAMLRELLELLSSAQKEGARAATVGALDGIRRAFKQAAGVDITFPGVDEDEKAGR